MSSKQHNSGANKKPTHFSREKNTDGKKKVQKEIYGQKNYRSTPALSSTTPEKSSLVKNKSSSKSSNVSDLRDDHIKASKERKYVNTQNQVQKNQFVGNPFPPNKNFKPGTTSAENFSKKKYDQGKTHYVPNAVSPCMAMQNHSVTMSCSKQSQSVPKFQHNNTQNQVQKNQFVGNPFPSNKNFKPGTTSAENFSKKKYDQGKTHYVPNAVSPCMAMQNHSVAMSCSKQSQSVPKFQHNNTQKNFNQFGVKPKIYNEPKHGNFRVGNKGIMDVKNQFPKTSENFKTGFERGVLSFASDIYNRIDKALDNLNPQFPISNTGNISYKYTSNAKQVPSYNAPFIKNSTPQIKYKKKKTDCNKQNFEQQKATKGFPRRAQKHKIRNFDCIKKVNAPETGNIIPLWSFQSNVEPEMKCNLIQFSDDDLIDFSDDEAIPAAQPIANTSLVTVSDMSTLPQFSNDDTPQSLSDCEYDTSGSDESDESDLASEFSVESSVLDSETMKDILRPNITKEEAFISVFWDIENCALPATKSAVDFANYIRSTFYEGRTEATFTAACDVSRLSSNLVREIDEAAITLIHVSSQSKNAADKKIMSFLQRFQVQYRKSDSAIVLISSDSDFSQILLDMRYQHHIFVNLICTNCTRSSLTTAASNPVLFDEVLNKLPNRDVKSDVQHVLFVSNLPQMKFKQIKNHLTVKLKSFNCRILYQNESTVKIIFKDHSVCVKAMSSLKGFYLGQNELVINYQKSTESDIILSKKEKKEKKPLKSLAEYTGKSGSSRTLKTKVQVTEDSNLNKSVTLCVFVSMNAGDIIYWKNAFEKLWNSSDFSILWDGDTFGGCFLINFKSEKKAKKAKKVLLKNQANDATAPKFLKLINEDEELSNLNMSDPEEQSKNKIKEHIQILEKKKMKFLRKHESIMNEIKNQTSFDTSETTEAVNEKLKEYKEQMETFTNFTNMIMNTIKILHYSSDDLDQKLKELLCDFTRECNCIASALPIYAKKEEILRKIREYQVIIIRAETGSGKSTQLTQYIWRDRNKFQNGTIICTQPRKIAAISLAKHVSSQIGCSLGDIVGYQVGMSSKMSENTKILYVTDFTMLKMLISGDVERVSFIIVDEAHERTIYTDILLGMIKQYLPRHPHLKVIITSATIDTSIFRDYFSLTENAVLHISGRTFPIEDVWLENDINADGDYFPKIINKAFDILTEEPGDVLSFLTTPLETEKALESFSKRLKGTKDEKNVKVFCLHGKMNSEEQQKIFEKTPKGVRKVIFATNCAETSITIPGIKYVVDCGLVKESQYDPVRNMNVLSVGFVSKSSAEQRRGRAGRTQVGKCFRLYSKKNYNSMASNTNAEILRINLGQALLKLLKFGVKNPLQFDFIQSPPKELLSVAMNQLLFLNAVDENLLLTELGKNMAALPLEPRLCHLIFQGFYNNIGYDALVTAALVTMSHTIFFRNSENKDEADKRKSRFCDSENDFISYLTVYKEWAEVPKNLKSQWCVINCINARSMRIVHELVNEIILILQNELNFKVKLKFNSESNSDSLLRIIFYSFSQNLSVFSGHPKCGYRCLNVSDPLLIHPSSSLSAFGQTMPEFVVYDTILKTSQTFIINVCPVTREMILNGISMYNLKLDLDTLEKLTGVECCISPVGEKIIFSTFIGKKSIKRNELKRKIREFTNSDFVEIDIDVTKGCIKVFGFGFDIDKIRSFILSIIYDAQQHLLNLENDVSLLEDGYLTAILAAGGCIRDVILPDEFRDLKIILKGQESIDTVIEKLSTCGTISEIREWNRYFKVTFKNPASAKNALDTYRNETDFSLQKINKYLPVNERDYLYKVFMSFFRRPCSGQAYITVEPKLLFLSVFSSMSSLLYEDTRITLSLSRKTQDLRLINVPANVQKEKLESLVSDILPPGVKITKFIIVRKKPYESTKEEMELIKNNIIQLFTEFTFKENITVYLKKPLANDFYWNATIYFKNSLDGETAVDVLRNRKTFSSFVGGFVLKPELQTYLCCKSQIFSVVKEEIQEALEFYKTNQSNFKIDAVPKGSEIIEIKIMSNNIKDITDARRCIHRILSGDELKLCESSGKAKLFSDSGKECLKKLSLEFQDCYILQNNYNKNISLFGKEASLSEIKRRINEFLNNLEDDDFKELHLKTESGKTGVLKELLKTYGYDLQKLKEDCDASDIQINKYKQMLFIQGSPSSIHKCESIIQNIKEKLTDRQTSVSEDEICPVCYDEVSEAKHRLQYCGHAYCTECLLHLFQNSKDIPLICEQENCQELIVLDDIFWAVDGRKALKNVLFDKFLHSFVNKRDDVSFCPSPNCPMIFRITEESMTIFKCPACGNSICTKCGDIYHSLITCFLHKCLKSGVDVDLKVWMEEDPLNRKLCPSCHSPIEKNGGCNHVTCWKCNCHMCWKCLATFPTTDEVYNHQPLCITVNCPLIDFLS